jgi:hypothetical protein
MEQQRDTACMERKQVLEQMEHLVKDHYEKTKKEKEEEMDQVAKETEVLKKQIDKIKIELTGEFLTVMTSVMIMMVVMVMMMMTTTMMMMMMIETNQ